MNKIRAIVLFLLVLGSAAWAAQNTLVFPNNPSWSSSPLLTSNPNSTYAFAEFNSIPGKFDRNADGRIDLIIADRNRDSKGDYWATDRNFDGLIDDYQYDRNLDGKIDQWEYDLDLDGVSDKIYVDANGDGKPEMYADLNPLNKTYTWYGDMKGVQASGKMKFPSLSSSRPYARGTAADSQ